MPKAKELRPFVERLITVAERGLAAGEANGRVLNARRLVMEDLQDREIVTKLFDTIAPRFAGAARRLHPPDAHRLPPGRQRRTAMVELIGSEFDPNAKVETPTEEAEAEEQGRRGRLRAAAERLRGTKKSEDDSRKVTAKPSRGSSAQDHDAAEGWLRKLDVRS